MKVIFFVPRLMGKGLGLCCLMTLDLNKDIWWFVCPYISTLAKLKIRHQAIQQVGCQPGDCMWLLYESSSADIVCVCMG